MQRKLIPLLLFLVLAHTSHAYYQAQQGRWLNRDPIGEAGVANAFAMVGNDCLNRVDWMGLEEWVFCYRFMLVTAYSVTGPGSDWQFFKPSNPGDPPGSVGPGTLAVADTKWEGVV